MIVEQLLKKRKNERKGKKETSEGSGVLDFICDACFYLLRISSVAHAFLYITYSEAFLEINFKSKLGLEFEILLI